MTLNELITAVRFKSNITNTATLSDTEITTELNQGYLEIFRAIVDTNEDYYEEQKTKFNLVALSSLYSLPTDHVKFKQLRLAYTAPTGEGDYKIAKSYDPAQTDEVNADEKNVPVSTPIVDITNNYMRIKPTPASDITNGGELYYIARPSALVNSADTPIIPGAYHDLMAIYGAAKVSEKFENYSVADRLENSFVKKIQRMKDQLAVRELNRDFRFRDIREINTSSRRELPN